MCLGATTALRRLSCLTSVWHIVRHLDPISHQRSFLQVLGVMCHRPRLQTSDKGVFGATRSPITPTCMHSCTFLFVV